MKTKLVSQNSTSIMRNYRLKLNLRQLKGQQENIIAVKIVISGHKAGCNHGVSNYSFIPRYHGRIMSRGFRCSRCPSQLLKPARHHPSSGATNCLLPCALLILLIRPQTTRGELTNNCLGALIADLNEQKVMLMSSVNMVCNYVYVMCYGDTALHALYMLISVNRD